MLTRLRNASASKKTEVMMPYSAMKYAIAKILEKEGYVRSVEKKLLIKKAFLRIELSYTEDQPRLQYIKRISKPGHRVYAKVQDLPRVMSDYGIAIVSTPNGLMTNKEARARRLGGEVICEVS